MDILEIMKTYPAMYWIGCFVYPCCMYFIYCLTKSREQYSGEPLFISDSMFIWTVLSIFGCIIWPILLLMSIFFFILFIMVYPVFKIGEKIKGDSEKRGYYE